MSTLPAFSSGAIGHRDEAASLHRRVIADPKDPWLLVPWGFASLQLARIDVFAAARLPARDRSVPAA